jgi:hypothetical protein
MESRELGRSGLEVSAVGLGCMGMSEFYGASDDATSINVLHHAIDGRCGAATSRTTSFPPAASSASAWLLTARSAAAS